jgi:hypothetical protein
MTFGSSWETVAGMFSVQRAKEGQKRNNRSFRYLSYCFDHPRFQPIPLSKARKYHRYTDRESDPESLGKPKHPYRSSGSDLRKYWNDYLRGKLQGLTVDRIVLVDHSSSGRSVEATIRILKDIFKDAGVRERFENVRWSLYNVVDASKLDQQTGALNVVSPRGLSENPIHRVAGPPGLVNRIVGDEQAHNRCQVRIP